MAYGEVFAQITVCSGLLFKINFYFGYFQMRSEILSAGRYGYLLRTYLSYTYLNFMAYGEVFSKITLCSGLLFEIKISLDYFHIRSEVLSAERYESLFGTY